jgi:TfoX/Sxy family transcriptional regulator of competence genes
MTTQIIITGQINSIYTLRSILMDYNAKEARGMFNSYILIFKTKKEAIKALSNGRIYLKAEGYNYSYAAGQMLRYDAATAIIKEIN